MEVEEPMLEFMQKAKLFHFEVNKEVDLAKLLYASNMLLPNDIHIKEMKEVDSDFHARYSAKRRSMNT